MKKYVHLPHVIKGYMSLGTYFVLTVAMIIILGVTVRAKTDIGNCGFL